MLIFESNWKKVKMQEIVDLEGKNILVVEDDDMNFIYLTQIFKITKGNIKRAKTGAQAKEIIQNNNFDLILMDIQLPDTDGNEITRWIREKNIKVPVVAQTASRSPEETKESLKAGCNKVLIKPFKIHDFSNIVASVI